MMPNGLLSFSTVPLVPLDVLVFLGRMLSKRLPAPKSGEKSFELLHYKFLLYYLNVFSQKLQGMETPSKWLFSMWFFKFLLMSSFPQILHL